MSVIISGSQEMLPMKVIKMDNAIEAKAYLSRSVEDTHSQKEQEALHRAIRYTKLFKQQESLDKMNEEGVMEHIVNLPKTLKQL